MTEKQRRVLLILIPTIIFILIIIGISYAYIVFTAKGTETNTITAGCLRVELTGENNISLNNQIPITDEEGKKLIPYTYTITNTCTLDAYYETAFSVSNVSSESALGYVKVMLDGNESLKPTILNNLPIATVPNSINTYNYLLASGVINKGETKTFNFRMWIDYNTEDSNWSLSGKIVNNAYAAREQNLDTSGANAPELAAGMIPVYYDSTNDVWRKADGENKQSQYRWYSYTSNNNDITKGMWANAVTVTETNRATYMNAALGTEIPMSDINTMFVWIPRFNAVTPSNYNGGTQTAPGAINVTFVDTTKPALDAFWWDENSNGVEDTNEQKSGFWFGKFETTGSLASACTTETCNVSSMTIKPNLTSLRSQTVSSFFYASRSMEQTNNPYGFDNTIDTLLDTHMLKNNEWGAAAYLTQSIYGRCTSNTSCSEVTINGNSSYYTGGNAYKTNINQSTTGTIYGIYDMNGGAWEYVMGNYNNTIGDSGFSSMPSSKYYNLYIGSSYTGHALIEIAGWYSDLASFVRSSNPWFMRGGNYSYGSSAGVLSFGENLGYARSDGCSRLSIVK